MERRGEFEIEFFLMSLRVFSLTEEYISELCLYLGLLAWLMCCPDVVSGLDTSAPKLWIAWERVEALLLFVLIVFWELEFMGIF